MEMEKWRPICLRKQKVSNNYQVLQSPPVQVDFLFLSSCPSVRVKFTISTSINKKKASCPGEMSRCLISLGQAIEHLPGLVLRNFYQNLVSRWIFHSDSFKTLINITSSQFLSGLSEWISTCHFVRHHHPHIYHHRPIVFFLMLDFHFHSDNPDNPDTSSSKPYK